MEEQVGNVKKGRKRSPNFSQQEKLLIAAIVNKYKAVIECKMTDAVTQTAKDKTWEKICTEFNSKGISPENRSADKLKVLWDNMKRTTKKHLSKIRQETFKTGGGKNEIKEDQLYIQIQGIIGNTGKPMDNAFDSDALPGEVTGNFGKDINNFTLHFDRCSELREKILPEYEETIDIVIDNDNAETEQAQPLKHDEMVNWSQWSPAMLKTKKSSSLRIDNLSMSKAEMSTESTEEGFFTNSQRDENHFSASVASSQEQANLHRQVLKRIVKKPYSRPRPVSERSKHFDNLIETKLHYIEMIKNETAEKMNLEKEVLRKKLIKQDLKIQLLLKKLEVEITDDRH